MKTTIKILALLIALAIPTQAKAWYYVGGGFDTKLIFKSDMYNASTPITEWGQAGVIWQICDWDPNGTSYTESYYDENYWNDETGSYGTWLTRTVYGGYVNNILEITLNTDVTINGPIYIPEDKTLIIHTNGHKIIPLRTTQAEWAASVSGNTGLSTITNSAGYYSSTFDLSSFRTTTSSGNLYEVKNSSGAKIFAYKYVPHCSFFVEGKLYINTGADDTSVCEIDGGNDMTNIAYEGDSPKTEIADQGVSGYKNYGGTFIYCSGDNDNKTHVKINNLVVKNFGPSYFNGLPFASFLNVGAWWFSTKNSHATIEMNNVKISNCYDDNDAGIILSCSGDTDSGRYAFSTITMNNCTIDGCWAGGKNHYGGVIKGSAFGYSNFTMNNCTIRNCISPGFGGAISWAPLGKYNLENSSLTLNNCTLTGNFARYMGGAICSEAVVNLNNCTLDGNTAGYAGGALAAMPNTIGEFTDNVGFNLVGNTISNNKTLYATNINNSNADDPGNYTPTTTVEAENNTSFRTSYWIDGVKGTTWGDINYPSGGGGIWLFLNKIDWNFSATIGEGNTITGNTSARAGGGVYVYKKAPANLPMTITLKGDITNNTAATVGGGFAMGSNATLPLDSEAPIITLTGGNIKGNTAGTDGGGLFMPAGTFNMTGGNIQGNKAPNGYGGGVAMGSTTTAFAHGTPDITLSSGSIQGNVAKFRGGGVFMPAGTFTMSGGNIENNTAGFGSDGNESDAGSGGGVGLMASADGQLPTFKLQNGNIFNNKATNGNGGGVALAAGTLNISNCDIYGNIATTSLTPGTTVFFNEKVRGSGGGIAMKNGSITVEGNSNIHSNQCSKFGAGLYTYKEWTVAPTTDAEYNSATFTGGRFHDNGKSSDTPCYSGGGICVEGPVKFTFSADVESNQAYNGGGIAIGAYAKMNYTGGLIRNNHAISPGTVNPTTGFEKTVIDVDGMGGGIFMGHHTSLAFNIPSSTGTDPTKFGIYNNIADHGADDIFANGLNTSITLPVVKDMTLEGLSVAKGSLFWVEDYITNDENYTLGTNKMGTEYPGTNFGKEWKNWRYRQALEREGYKFYTVDGGTTLNGYVSLALGYQIIYINIVKTGMKPGDSALFKVQSGGSDYLNVLLTSETDKVPGSETTDANGVTTVTLKKRVCLIGGDWTVVEVDKWSWAYTAVTGTDTTISKSGLVSDSSEEDRTFTFQNNYVTGIPKHDEGVKVNKIIPIE